MLGSIFRRSEPNWRVHVNPDGSKGGMVSTSATIEEGAVIPVSAVVMPGVHIAQDDEIHDGDLVTSDGNVNFSRRPSHSL